MGFIKNTLGRGQASKEDTVGAEAEAERAEASETPRRGRRGRLLLGLLVLGAVAYVLVRRRRDDDSGFTEIELETESAAVEG